MRTAVDVHRSRRRQTLVALGSFAFIPARAEADETLRFDVQLTGARSATPNTLRVRQGDTAEIRWVSDQAVQLHLHGYDVELTLSPSIPAVMRLQATMTGRFPIAVHRAGAERRHKPVAYLEVHPR